MPFVKCNSCGKQFSDKLASCPFCDGSVGVETTAPAKIQQVVTSQGKRYVNPIIVVSIVVALGISFLGFKFYQDLQRRNANREFSALVGEVSGKLIDVGSRSEVIVDKINREWRDAIFSDSHKRDFNTAILEVRMESAKDITVIQDMSKSIGTDIKNMNPPEGKERDFQRLKDLYLLFDKYADMAASPTGSLQTYSQQNSQLTVEIKSAIKELELMK